MATVTYEPKLHNDEPVVITLTMREAAALAFQLSYIRDVLNSEYTLKLNALKTDILKIIEILDY